MAVLVVAQVILRTSTGLSILDAEQPITSENVADYEVESSVIEEASKRLSSYGFTIGEPGPTGFSISGEPTLFEKVFAAQLESVPASETTTADETAYKVNTPLLLPEDLSGLVADVAIASPPELLV